MNGMAIYDWDTEQFIAYTERLASDVRRYYRSSDQVLGKGGSMSSRGTSACYVKAEAQEELFRIFGKIVPGQKTVRMATPAQISYLHGLGVQIEQGMTMDRASQLIDAAKNGCLGSVNGFYTDGSN